MSSKKVILCTGIGDNLWVLQKLAFVKEPIHFIIPYSDPNRALPLFELFAEQFPHASYEMQVDDMRIGDNDALNKNDAKDGILWSGLKKELLYLSANKHLESGQLLKDWLPDLPITYDMSPYLRLPDEAKSFAEQVMPYNGTYYIGLYASSHRTSQAWKFWTEAQWHELTLRLKTMLQCEVKFVLFGADYDKSMADALIIRLKASKIPYINLVGQSLPYTTAALLRVQYLFALASGIPILATLLGTANVMFYPNDHIHRQMLYTWAGESREASNYQFHTPAYFCEPKDAVTIFWNYIKSKQS